MARARQQARKVVVATNQRAILLGCWTYASDHDGAWPESLAVLEDKYIAPQTLISPFDPAAGMPYVYLNPGSVKGGDQPPPSVRIVLYEAYEVWPALGAWAGFADGHIELIREEERLLELLEASTRDDDDEPN